MKRKKTSQTAKLQEKQSILSILRKVKIMEARISFLEEENTNLKSIIENLQKSTKIKQ